MRPQYQKTRPFILAVSPTISKALLKEKSKLFRDIKISPAANKQQFFLYERMMVIYKKNLLRYPSLIG